MDDALRMHDDVDSVVWKAEEKMCFDHLQRLVRQRRAVDGDLATHAPGWMSKRILDGRILELVFAPSPERTARRSENDSPHICRGTTRDALQNRAVLAVHGNYLATAFDTRALGKC